MDFSRELHSAEAALLRFFTYDHLPDRLAAISAPFGRLAGEIVRSCPPGAETTTALRKLLEAKDCAVRAALGLGEGA